MKPRACILLATDFYSPFIGGTELQIELIAKQFALKGYSVHVVTMWHHGQPEIEQDEGVTIHRLKGLLTQIPLFFSDPSSRRYHPPFPEPRIVLKLCRLINELQPDVIHSSGWITFSVALASLGTNSALIASTADFGSICATRTMLYYGKEMCAGPQLLKCAGCASKHYGFLKAISAVLGVRLGRELLARCVSAFHTNSIYVQKIVTQYFPMKSRTENQPRRKSFEYFRIPNISQNVEVGVEETRYLHLLPNTPYILFVGALQYHKGIQILLDAYALLEDPPSLVLIGTVWPDSPKEYPVGVILVENVPHNVVMKAWDRCLFGVCPSICAETFGNVIVEAMSKGKAVISSNLGGPLDIIVNEVTGLLIPPGNVQLLAQAMQRLIEDENLRNHMGQAGRERVEQYFSARVVIPQFEELFQQVARKHDINN